MFGFNKEKKNKRDAAVLKVLLLLFEADEQVNSFVRSQQNDLLRTMLRGYRRDESFLNIVHSMSELEMGAVIRSLSDSEKRIHAETFTVAARFSHTKAVKNRLMEIAETCSIPYNFIHWNLI